MPDPLSIEIKGLDRLLEAFDKFPREIRRDLAQAGKMAAEDVLETEGLGHNYPDAPPSSTPPVPYYKRGTGYMYADGGTDNSSENLGKQWYIKKEGYAVRIGNRASYAKYAHDDKLQKTFMRRIGWKKLRETFIDKMPQIVKVYQQMVDRTIKRLGL